MCLSFPAKKYMDFFQRNVFYKDIMTTVECFQDVYNMLYDMLQKQLELACCEQWYCSGEGSFGMYL